MNDPVNNEQAEAFEFGLYTLGDLSEDRDTGHVMSAGQRLKEIVAAAKLADDAGIQIFGVGEHHRLDFAVSSPPVLLAAIAGATRQIRLTSATTVLGTADPVRVFEDFATLDLLSDGRAEIIAGRGAYIESFSLFGFELEDYKELFAEKIGLLIELNNNERMNWNGRLRPALINAEIAPRPMQDGIPLWIGVGGTPESAELAGSLGTGIAIAILGGDPGRFQPHVDAYKRAFREAGHPEANKKMAITSHGFIGATSQQARESFYPYYAKHYSQFMEGRTSGQPLTRDQFEQMTSMSNALAVGSPEEIVEKILMQHEKFGHNRFMAQFDVGGIPYAKVAESIELFAAKVIPAVRRALRKNK